RPEQARADFDASRQAYVRAADIGRSDPSLHHALARLESAVVDMEVYNRREVELPLERGLQALERTLTAAPDAYAYEARVLQARLFRRLAEFRAHQSKGKDVQEPVEKAREAAEAARKLAPERPEAWMELARSYWRLGRNLQARQEDPSEKLRDSLAALEHLAPKDHNYEFHLLRGLIFKTWSEYEELSGLDSLPRLDLAIESYRKAIQLNEERPSAWLNLAYASLLHSTWGNSPDPAGDLEQARLALAKVRALNPHYILLSEYEANYHEQLARWTRAQGGDARPHWEKALALYEQGLTLDGESESLLNGRGHVLVQLGQEAWDRGGDPFPWFARAEASYEKASRVAPERFLAHSNLGATNARRAMYQLARGENPTPSLLASVEAYQRAISRAQEHVNPRTYLGRSLQLLAAFELEQGRDPRKSLARASDALHQALSRNATSAEALAQLAQVRSLEARWKARQGQARSEDFEATAAAFQRALHQDPKNQDLRLAFGRFHLGQAAWKKELGQEPLASLEQGLALARELLTERPLWADALLLRASLELTRMEVAARPEPQVLDQARKDIDRALASNRNLEREARQQLSRLRKLLARAR
ncbi:MAG TPA: serine/threonine protein kinase, partial [Archangium sp.]